MDPPVFRYKRWDRTIASIAWPRVWRQCYDNFSENRLCDVHWRVLHRSLPLATVLHKHNGSSSPYCSLCPDNQHETLEHLFFQCTAVQPLLRQTANWITRLKGSPFTLDIRYMITNIDYQKKDFVTLLCNYIINVTRCAIWTCRNIRRFELRSVNLQTFARLIVKERLNVEYFTHLHLQNNLPRFAGTWVLNDVLCTLDGTKLIQLL